MSRTLSIALLFTALSGVAASADQADFGQLDARRVGAAALAEARRLGAPGGAVAVVDAGGHLLFFERLPGTFPAAARVSEGKARTAALFQRPTKVFEQVVVEKGRTSMVALDDFTPLQGGVPIERGGRVVGAIGVSGAASADQDSEIAEAAVAAFGGHGSAGVTYFDAGEVSAAFAKGAPLTEVGDFKIHASRRSGAGRSEVHEADTDVFYVLEGSAVLVTGGELTDPETIGPGEVRGSGIRGGEIRNLSKGDVIAIPRGTPHWFKEVSGPVLYYVVKVTG